MQCLLRISSIFRFSLFLFSPISRGSLETALMKVPETSSGCGGPLALLKKVEIRLDGYCDLGKARIYLGLEDSSRVIQLSAYL